MSYEFLVMSFWKLGGGDGRMWINWVDKNLTCHENILGKDIIIELGSIKQKRR